MPLLSMIRVGTSIVLVPYARSLRRDTKYKGQRLVRCYRSAKGSDTLADRKHSNTQDRLLHQRGSLSREASEVAIRLTTSARVKGYTFLMLTLPIFSRYLPRCLYHAHTRVLVESSCLHPTHVPSTCMHL